jgi:hypothetical protein
MTEVYDYAVSNIPAALMSIVLIPLAFMTIWRILVRVLNGN